MVDRHGAPLAVTLSGATLEDSKALEEAIDAIPPLRLPGNRRGRPRHRPVKVHADKGYDYPRCRQALRLVARATRTAALVAERSLSWVNRFLRLKVRYRPRADIHEAFVALGQRPRGVGMVWLQKPLGSAKGSCQARLVREDLHDELSNAGVTGGAPLNQTMGAHLLLIEPWRIVVGITRWYDERVQKSHRVT